MSAAAQNMEPGLPVVLGGVSLVLPPLNAKLARKYWPRLGEMQEGREDDPLGLVAEVVHACLLRNYPAITLDEVEESVNFDNFEGLLAMVSGQGAFRRWCQQQAALQAADAGNVATQPQTPATAGTGAESTPPSPPPPAGDSPTSTS